MSPDLPLSACAAASLPNLLAAFHSPPPEARPMVRWWWFGPTVDCAGIDRELVAMRNAGIGGVEVQPVYPLVLDDADGGRKNLPFMSEEFLRVLGHAARKANELGLRFDLTLGSGWPFGGPSVTPQQASPKLNGIRIPVPPGSDSVSLPAPGSGKSFWRPFPQTAPGN